MIVGVGVDIQQVATVQSGLRSPAFAAKVFTPAEIALAQQQPRRFYERMAGKFAAKEACMKALGSGIRQGVWFNDIEVLNHESGAPFLVLHRRAEQIAADKGVTTLHLSISHAAGVAVGVVVLEG